MLTIILSIAGGVLGLIILWVIIALIIGKKKKGKLDQNIKKLKEEKENLEKGGTLTIASEKPEEKLPQEAKIEELEEIQEVEKPLPPEETQIPETLNFGDDKSIDDFFKDLDNFDKTPEKPIKKRKKSDDFEDFLDKHSYTRRIIDKNILKKIQELPPEIKAIVISNIFSRPQD